MENVKQILRENLVAFRKANKLTQLELSQKINYSDKAISRWETGEVTPDVETINLLSELYNVPIEYFFKKTEKRAVHSIKLKKLQIGNKTAFALLAICTVWLAAIILFVYSNTFFKQNNWMYFIWAIPATCALAAFFISRWGSTLFTYLFVSLTMWTLLLAIYLHFLSYNIYLLFVIGAPLQISIILWSYIRQGNRQEKK